MNPKVYKPAKMLFAVLFMISSFSVIISCEEYNYNDDHCSTCVIEKGLGPPFIIYCATYQECEDIYRTEPGAIGWNWYP